MYSYRRIKQFFNWLVERGHRESNPVDLVAHPHVTKRAIPKVSEREMLDLFRWLDIQPTNPPSRRFRVTRDRAVCTFSGTRRLWNTPGRRNELTTLTMDALDLDGVGDLDAFVANRPTARPFRLYGCRKFRAVD